MLRSRLAGLFAARLTRTPPTRLLIETSGDWNKSEQALAAIDNDIPFYVALPGPTIDWETDDGNGIPIEERPGEEVSTVTGQTASGVIQTVRITPEGSAVHNPAFDVTPARLVTGLITERGIADASPEGLLGLFPERRNRKIG